MSYYNPAAKITANTQASFEYAIFMIFGSYFRSAECKNPSREGALRINYNETKTSLQYEMEELCDKEAEKLFKRLPKDVARNSTEVSFIRESGYPTEIRFTGDSFILRVMGVYRKGAGKIITEFWNK